MIKFDNFETEYYQNTQQHLYEYKKLISANHFNMQSTGTHTHSFYKILGYIL